MAKQTEETNAINAYIAELNRKYRQGYATEHSYRSALEALFKGLTSGLSITNEPKHIECGAPDYIVMRSDIPIGYIEAKGIGTDLSCKASREQLDRYRRSLNNLIITDYIRFQLYADGELVTSASVAKSNRSGIDADSSQFDAFLALLNRFAGYGGPTIRTSVNLSKATAAKAKFLATVIEEALKADDANKDTMNGNIPTIYGQLRGVRDVLISEISIKEFSDIYAQTVAYGMFAAKLNDSQASAFTRDTAAKLITPSNPFLRNFFQYIAGFDLDERIRWVVDDLADLFNHVDIDAIVDEFGKAEHDPIIHFYETFLTEYDPVLRKSRGVWYTPRPIVQFIVRSVDEILKQEFKLSDGLADASKVKIKQKIDSGKEEEKEYHKVQILDPATGTGTFLAEIVKHIYSKYQTRRQGEWQSYATEHLIPRISGFEILMASYTVAHIKLDMILRQTNYRHPANKRLRIYLTNSLEEAKTRAELLFAQWLSDEANEASKVKRDVPLMVVVGNPPYSGESQNHGERMGWIDTLLGDYKKEPTGEKLRERNSKWLNDDYVKFMRYGQYFVEKNAGGILAYITNHSFLDNPTFRGMRYNLLKTFDKIYILDLHGNAKKKEAAPDGSKDENVFNIKQGVSINIFVKTGRTPPNKLAEVFHCDLYGEREGKFNFLQKNSLKSLKWHKIELMAPMYFFAVKDFSHIEEYENGFSVSELFQVKSIGIVTSRDELTIHQTAKSAKNTICAFIKLDTETARAKFNLGKDARDWSVAGAQRDLTAKPDFRKIIKIDYRPFDTRYTYYTGHSRGFHCMPRDNVMQHLLNGENVGLVFRRQQPQSKDLYIFCAQNIVADGYIRSDNKGGETIAPLYLYHDGFIDAETRKPNLNKAIVSEFAQKTGLRFTEEKEGGKTFAPIDVLDYIYAVLHSPAYRERYKEFLKIDFPRVPYPKDAKSFRHLVGIGAALRQLHLMIDVAPKKGLADFPIEGASVIETPRYADQKVYINADQYFGHVPPEAWEFYVGGYQPAQKWLKDHIGQTLCIDDIWHYQKIVFVLCETAKIMKKLQNIEDLTNAVACE